jgi:hypothetical protein
MQMDDGRTCLGCADGGIANGDYRSRLAMRTKATEQRLAFVFQLNTVDVNSGGQAISVVEKENPMGSTLTIRQRLYVKGLNP